MMLKSFGCSFIFGTDLPDANRTGGCASFSRLTWPAILSRKLGLKYKCYARPGSGNLRILEQILTQAAANEKDFFVIGWSWIDRFDYFYNESWQTILPVDKTSHADFYYRNIHSEYTDKFTTLTYIRTAIDTLEQKQTPFLMTYTDPLMFDQTWHTSPAIIDIQNQIKPYMHLFDNLTFLDWSRKNNFEISKTLHPLESAHKSAANIMLPISEEKIQKIVL